MSLKQILVDYLDKTAIPEWRSAWRLLSVQGGVIMGLLTTSWLAVPDADRSAFASMLGVNPGYVLLAGIVVNVYLRLKAQPAIADKTDPAP
jgi:hypothetical protein